MKLLPLCSLVDRVSSQRWKRLPIKHTKVALYQLQVFQLSCIVFYHIKLNDILLY